MKDSDPSVADASRQGAFSRALHSIRSRYSLSTAAFLLFLLALFYAGGRVVLVHLIRDAEEQVKELGTDLSRLVYKDAEQARRRMEAILDGAVPADGRFDPRGLLSSDAAAPVLSLAVSLSPDGKPVGGVCRAPDGRLVDVPKGQFDVYRQTLTAWCGSLSAGRGDGSNPIGLMRIAGQQHYVTVRRVGGSFAVLGVPFSAYDFGRTMGGSRAGMSIRVTHRQVDVAPRAGQRYGQGAKRNEYGFAPLFSEAANFYTGGFWDLNTVPFEAVFAVRDIAGNVVSMISVSLPKTLASVTSLAISRLTLFVAVAGILVVLPIFWIQGRILLNPLTRMTHAVRELGERHDFDGCPMLEWEGKDEFAVLAASVNRMLETVSAKSVAIAQMERRHKALIDGLPDAVAVFDARGRLVTVSKEAEGVQPLPGFRTGEPPDPAVFGEAEAAHFAHVLAETVETGSIGQVRLKVQRPAGVPRSVPTRHFEVRLTRMDDRFVMAIVRDVSEEVAEHKLRLDAEKRAVELSGDVLVVDNDEAILKTISILLKALKLNPRVARDRREALAVLRRHTSSLRAIVLDAHLGGIDTVRLLRAFRVGAPNVPVIVSSGSSEDEIREMFSTHPYDWFLAKPYTLEELKRAVSMARS